MNMVIIYTPINKNMENTQPISEFKAIFNPFTRNLLVRYGDALIEGYFENIEEWTEIYFNNDNEQPYYLHVQLDYDETLQLLFYPRVEGSQDLNEDLGSYYNTENGLVSDSEQIHIVLNDYDWDIALKDFLGCDDFQYGYKQKIPTLSHENKIKRNITIREKI